MQIKSKMKLMLALCAAVLVAGFAFAATVTKTNVIWDEGKTFNADVTETIDLGALDVKVGDAINIYVENAGATYYNEVADARAAAPMRELARNGELKVLSSASEEEYLLEETLINTEAQTYTINVTANNIDKFGSNTITVVARKLTITKIEVVASEEFNPETAIVNPGFELSEAVTASIGTTGDAQGTDYESTGWKLAGSAAWGNAAVFAYASEAQLNSTNAPAKDAAGNRGNALGVTVGWEAAVTYQSAETIVLPAGTYCLVAEVYNANPSAQQLKSQLGFIPSEGEAFISSVNSFTSGYWTVDYVEFTLDAQTEGVFQVGGKAFNSGSGANAKVFIDNIALTDAEGLAAIQQKILAANIAINAAFVEGAAVDNPVDAPFIINGAFNDADMSKWQATGGFQNNVRKTGDDNNSPNMNTNKPWYENWTPAANKAANKMSQVVKFIPNGTYKLSITAFVNTLAAAPTANRGAFKAEANQTTQFVFANGDKTYLDEAALKGADYEVYTEVTDNQIEVGLEQTEAIANWMGIDNVALTYYGAECTKEQAYDADHSAEAALAAAKEALQAEITTAEALLADESKTEGRNVFSAAITTAKALLESTDADEITAGIQPLKDAEAAFVDANIVQLVSDGSYYVIAAAYDEPQLFMAAGKNWGTKGIVNEKGLDLKFTFDRATQTYTIDTNIYNGNSHFLGSDLFMDAPAFGWTIEGDFVYTIGAVIEGKKQYIAVASDSRLYLTEDANAENAQWAFIMKDYWENEVLTNGLTALQAATATAPVDATFLLKDPDFNRNDHRWEAWTVTGSITNLGGGCDETHGNGCAESYHKVFTISQVVANAPAGIYKVTAQGFYRQDEGVTEDAPIFFANDESVSIPELTGSENSMTAAGNAFETGSYTAEPIYVEVATDGTLTVGVQSSTNTQWVIWDNFQLTYYGSNATIDEVKNASILAELNELKQKAETLKADVEVEAVTNALDEAINNATGVTSEEDINDAINGLKDAIAKAETSIAAKNALNAMRELTNSTNFYTADALNTYYTQWLLKYEDGTLTKAEADALQDPNVITNWHAANTVDDLLMSVWDAAPEAWDTYHVNTWSTEGENDGSNFKVPFIEYWTDNNLSLAAKALTARIEGLEAGEYEVSAWVRVRMKNDAEAPAAGITMQVNEGEAANVCDGVQVGNTQLYLKEVTATGAVGQDGQLTLVFNVADNNNISWLAFKNVICTVVATVAEAKTALQTLVDAEDNANRNGDNYTDESWTAYSTALDAAKQALANNEATVESLTTAKTNLEAAIEGLTETSEEPSEPTSTTLYSWQSPEGTVSETGGTISYENGDGNRLNYQNSGYYTICLNGKKGNMDDTTPSVNAGYMLITLNEALVQKCTISMDAYITKSPSTTASAYFVFENGTTLEGAEYSDEANIHVDFGGSITNTTVTIPDEAAGSKTIKITRSKTGTNLFITKLVISKPEAATGISTVGAARQLDGAVYNLRGQRVEQPAKGLYIIGGKKVVIK